MLIKLRCQTSSLGLKLLYGTERVCPDTLAALADLAKERGALAKMKQMQARHRPTAAPFRCRPRPPPPPSGRAAPRRTGR